MKLLHELFFFVFSSTETVKESTLEAIGYICQDIQDHRCLEVMSNDILTAIVHGMKRDEPSPHVRLAATNALLNSLEFTRANFETDVSFLLSLFCTVTLQCTEKAYNDSFFYWWWWGKSLLVRFHVQTHLCALGFGINCIT